MFYKLSSNTSVAFNLTNTSNSHLKKYQVSNKFMMIQVVVAQVIVRER